MDVNTGVSPSLHPSNVTALKGYDESTADAVADAVGAFDTAYASLTRVHAARKAASENPTLTEAAQVLVVADFAEKNFRKITAKFDAAYARLKAAIADGERQLSQPLEGGSAGGFTAEIRAHVKGLSQADRLAFMNDAVHSGDTKTLSAVLGAPSYLSGLSSTERDLFTRSHQERTNPTLAKRLVVMKAANDLIAQRAGLIFDEIDKAIGASSTQVANLRAARAKAEKAYTFTA
jgi:hypothetical protein